MAGMNFGFMLIFNGLFIGMYLIPTIYLYRFSTKMRIALDSNDQESLSYSFRNMKSMFKFWGIFIAIILGFYAVMFLIAIISLLFVGGIGAS